jgi:hypothetical protein
MRGSIFGLLGSLLMSTMTFAQSSGNFSARIATMQCEINNQTGTISGGLSGNVLETTIQTPNSGQTALLIRPSLDIGLYTRTKVPSSLTEATAIAGVRVRVLLDGKVVAPGVPVGAVAGPNDGWVVFEQRFQRLRSNIPSFLGEDCNPDAAVIEPCFIETILGTLSMHSGDFVVGDTGGGNHNVKLEWQLTPTSASSDQAACVGPGVLTVQQVKTFNTGGGIVVTNNN